MKTAGAIIIGLMVIVAGLALLNWQSQPPLPQTKATALNSLKPQTVSVSPASKFFRRMGDRRPAPATLEWPSSPFQLSASTLAEVPVAERMTYSEHLLELNAGKLFDLWLEEAGKAEDPLKLDFISCALSHKLRTVSAESSTVFSQLEDYLSNSQNNSCLRWHLVEMLGETATPEALEVLLKLAQTGTQHPDLEPIVLRQITRMGDILWDQRFHEELSPVLEQAWKSAKGDDALTKALAVSLAKVGAPSGMELLLAEITAGGRILAQFETQASEKAWGAFDALAEFRNVSSLPLLAEKLQGQSPESMAVVAVGYALANMGQPDATQLLIDWVRKAPAEVSLFVSGWFSQMRDSSSVKLTAEAIESPAHFANLENHRQLQRILAEWNVHRSE